MTRLPPSGRRLRRLGLLVLGTALLAGPAVAHTGTLRLGQEPPPVPTWLVVMTGGGVIGLSFLFASLVTDHALIRSINGRRLQVSVGSLSASWAVSLLRWAAVALLAATLVIAFVGPAEAAVNAAVLLVWAAWWAGYTTSVYLVGNSWPLLNPWRSLAAALPSLERRPLPERVGPWAAIVGLLGLIWLEVVTPVAGDPRVLGVVIVAYTLVTLAGTVRYGPSVWFDRVDPVARVFRCYGHIAPVQRTPEGVELRWPGAAATDPDRRADAEPAFVVAVLWATTYDGLVSTPAWRAAISPLVEGGVPPRLLYLFAIVLGYGAFLGIYRLAARRVRSSADSYLDPDVLEDQFATSLLPIAAGYHAAHFLAYVISLLPAMAVVAASPLTVPASVPTLTIPAWFGGVGLLFILVGHVIAIWIAHAVSFELFAGRLQPLRSQYPLVALMIAYTMTSMWIVIQPTVAVAYVA